MAEDTLEQDKLKTWRDVWETGQTRWHHTNLNQIFVKTYNTITSGKHGLTFLIPLCGKALELAWLYHQGNVVIGIEAVEKGVKEFLQENNLEYTMEKFDVGLLYQTLDKRLRIYCADFFKLSSDIIGQVDCVWDRGSLVAINKEDREKYAAMMKSYLKPSFQYVLEIIEYDVPVRPSVFPRTVSCDEVKQLYGDVCNITLLASSDRDLKELPQVTGATWIKVHNLLLTNKKSG